MDIAFAYGGPFLFGVVVGWITYRTLRRAPSTGISDLASVIAAVGGAGVTAVIGKDDQHAFNVYCVGLAIGFFAYAVIAHRVASVWLGDDQEAGGKSGIYGRS